MKTQAGLWQGWRRSAAGLLAVAMALALALAVWALDRVSIGVQPMTYAFSYGFFVNALPFWWVWLLLLVVSRRILVATLPVLLLALAIYAANYLKLRELVQPLTFGDLFLVRDFHWSTVGLLSNYIQPAKLLLVSAIFCVLIWAGVRFEPPMLRARGAARLGLIVVLATSAATSVLATGRTVGRLYTANALRAVPWSPAQTILHAGLAGALIHDGMQYVNALREPAVPADIEAFLRLPAPTSQVASSTTNAPKPDIVVIQSESFFDPGIVSGVGDTRALLPNLHRAVAAGDAGVMQVPTFGGGTLRTEFEVLTGVPLAAYPKIEFPYLQINRARIPSLAWVLRGDGYDAYAIHPNQGGFWNRRRTFAAMGFQHFYARSEFPADATHDGWFLADSALTTKIEQVLSNADRPTFIMAISIEAHGPYSKIPVADKAARDAIPVPASWSAKAANEYRNYAYHIHHADHELGRIWKFLQARGRPFVLVFYGDHLPALDHVYRAAAGFVNGQAPEVQPVPWLMVSGGGVQSQVADHAIPSWTLGSEVLASAGLTLPPYYAQLDRAGRLLTGSPDARQVQAVTAGVDSLARLYLSGQPLPTAAGQAADAEAQL